jgi:hypothetical protein
MATTATPPKDLDAATQQLKDLNEKVTDAGRRVGNLYLDSYERTVEGVTSFQQKLAEQTPIDGVQTFVDAQVRLTREVVKAQTSAAREFLS